MKKYSLAIVTLLTCVSMAFLPISPVQAAGPGFFTRITYQNIGLDTAHVTVLYYPDGSATPVSISQPDLPPGGSQSVDIGKAVPGVVGTAGSAVLKSDMELAILATHIPVSTGISARGMATAPGSGSSKIWLGNLMKIQAGTTILSIQNLDTVPVDVNLTFHGTSAKVTLTRSNIPSGASVAIDLSDVNEIPSPYIGTAVITALQSGTDVPGMISGMAVNFSGSTTEAYSTESIALLSKTIYMPFALCYAMGGMSTTYYVFNPDPTLPATVTVRYNTGKVETQTVAALSQTYFNACKPSGTAAGYSGSAVISSTGPAILSIGTFKLMGMSATFTGQTAGGEMLALPYAPYSTSGYAGGQKSRTTIAVMNLSNSLAAGVVKARFYGRDGTLAGTVSLPAIAAGARVDLTAAQIGTAGAEFGYYSDGSSGGSVVIQGPAGSKLVATALVLNTAGSSAYAGDAYNAVIP